MTYLLTPTVQLNNGFSMPQLALGTFAPRDSNTASFVYDALSLGYRHLDCAAVYGNELEVGQGIRAALSKGILKRSEIFVTSKVWNTDHTTERVIASCHKSLNDLGLDYLDMLLVHWPIAQDPIQNTFSETDYVETWLALEQLVDQNKVRSIGVSNFNVAQLDRLLHHVKRHKPTVNQVEVHPYLPNEELFQFCKKNNIILAAYATLGSKDRFGAKASDPDVLKDPIVCAMAERYAGRSPAQILIRYVLQRGIVAVVKSSNPKRLKENLHVFDFTLSDTDLQLLNSIKTHFRYLSFPLWKKSIHYPFHDDCDKLK